MLARSAILLCLLVVLHGCGSDDSTAGSGGGAAGSAGTGTGENLAGSMSQGGQAGAGGSGGTPSFGGGGVAGAPTGGMSGGAAGSGVAGSAGSGQRTCGTETCGANQYCRAGCSGTGDDPGPPRCAELPPACEGEPTCACICGLTALFCTPGAPTIQCGCG